VFVGRPRDRSRSIGPDQLFPTKSSYGSTRYHLNVRIIWG
jgi:hypothetical protein